MTDVWRCSVLAFRCMAPWSQPHIDLTGSRVLYRDGACTHACMFVKRGRYLLLSRLLHGLRRRIVFSIFSRWSLDISRIGEQVLWVRVHFWGMFALHMIFCVVANRKWSKRFVKERKHCPRVNLIETYESGLELALIIMLMATAAPSVDINYIINQ